MTGRATIFTLSDVIFPDDAGLPLIPLDALDGPGVQIIHDIRSPDCLAAGPLVDSTLANPTIFHNLSHNRSTEGSRIVETTPVVRDGQGLKFSRPNGGVLADYVAASGTVPLDIAASQSFMVTAWVKQNQADNYQGVISSMGSIDNAADVHNAFGVFINGADAGGIVARYYDGVGGIQQNSVASAFPPGPAIRQVAFGLIHNSAVGTRMLLGIDGQLQFDTTYPYANGMRPTASPLMVGTAGTSNQGAASLYRWTLSYFGAGQDTRTPAQYVAQDYAANVNGFA